MAWPFLSSRRMAAMLSSGEEPVNRKRVQRLMRAATGPESVRKAFEVDLVYLIEDRHHSLLNDFVLQCCDAQRTLPPISLRDVDSPRRSCPVRSTVHPAVQIA